MSEVVRLKIKDLKWQIEYHTRMLKENIELLKILEESKKGEEENKV